MGRASREERKVLVKVSSVMFAVAVTFLVGR